MQCSMVPFRSVCTAFLLCLALLGCGASYPHYTLEGSAESRVVVIHLDETKTEKIPAGSGIGGGITNEMKSQMGDSGEATIEKDSAKVTIVAKGMVFLVKKVEYDGKEVYFHEPIF